MINTCILFLYWWPKYIKCYKRRFFFLHVKITDKMRNSVWSHDTIELYDFTVRTNSVIWRNNPYIWRNVVWIFIPTTGIFKYFISIVISCCHFDSSQQFHLEYKWSPTICRYTIFVHKGITWWSNLIIGGISFVLV